MSEIELIYRAQADPRIQERRGPQLVFSPAWQWPFLKLFVFFSPLNPFRFLLRSMRPPRTHTLSGKPPAKHISLPPYQPRKVED